MIKKDKVYELKIEEDDEVSGIDSISLVDEPAIEINWMFFNKVKQEDFHIPDGEDQSYIDRLVQRAENEQDFFDEGWVVESVEQLNREDFVSTDPNGPSSLDEKEYKVRYKYMLNPDISGQSSIIPTTRDFCKELIRGNYVWRIEDMTAITNDEGDSAIRWRGGYNCRHVWSRIKYRNDARIINKASVNTGKELVNGFPNDLIPDEYIPGHVQSDTRVPAHPSFSKEKFVEDCPPATQDVAINLKNRQNAIDTAHYGPLNPNEPNEEYWSDKAKMFGGDVQSAKKALCGNCSLFVQTKSMLNCIAGGIDDVNEWDTIEAGDLGYCEAFDFKCSAARTCDAWVGGGPIVEESMESVSDYPESVKNNAKAVLDYVEQNGWGSCGTDVGKQRANQLAKGEPISMDTVQRMYSYLSRHKVDLESSKGYGDGCGKLMYDSWGGLSALSWAESKIKEFTIQKFAGQKVSFDFDGTLSTLDGQLMAKRLIANGYDVYIVTSRGLGGSGEVYRMADKVGIKRNNVHFTSGKPKWITLKQLGITKHYDNNPDVIKDIKKNAGNIQTVQFGYDNNLPTYVDEGIKKKKKKDQKFQVDDEKRIIVGPAMVPDLRIPRKDSEGNLYEVYFSSETIKMIAEKYMRNKYTDNNDMMHDGNAVRDIHVMESWIVEDPEHDKAKKYGYDVPSGTWMISMKVNNPKVWEQILEKKLNGFSVSGYFEEVAQFTREEMFLYKVAEVLKNVKD